MLLRRTSIVITTIAIIHLFGHAAFMLNWLMHAEPLDEVTDEHSLERVSDALKYVYTTWVFGILLFVAGIILKGYSRAVGVALGISGAFLMSIAVAMAVFEEQIRTHYGVLIVLTLVINFLALKRLDQATAPPTD